MAGQVYKIWKSATAPAFTYGIHATPRSGDRAVAGSQPCRCCVSQRRSAAGGGGRTASWLEQLIWPGSSPLLRSTASAGVGPRCKPSAPPVERLAQGPKPLGIVGERDQYYTQIWWNNISYCFTPSLANKLLFTGLHMTYCLSKWRQQRTVLPLFCNWRQNDADSRSESSHLLYTLLHSEPSLSHYCCPSTKFPLHRGELISRWMNVVNYWTRIKQETQYKVCLQQTLIKCESNRIAKIMANSFNWSNKQIVPPRIYTIG